MRRKPVSTEIEDRSDPLLSILCDLGISSSITTYSMAPAAKDKKNGNRSAIKFEKIITVTAAAGSTIPDKSPNKNDRILLMPSA